MVGPAPIQKTKKKSNSQICWNRAMPCKIEQLTDARKKLKIIVITDVFEDLRIPEFDNRVKSIMHGTLNENDFTIVSFSTQLRKNSIKSISQDIELDSVYFIQGSPKMSQLMTHPALKEFEFVQYNFEKKNKKALKSNETINFEADKNQLNNEIQKTIEVRFFELEKKINSLFVCNEKQFLENVKQLPDNEENALIKFPAKEKTFEQNQELFTSNEISLPLSCVKTNTDQSHTKTELDQFLSIANVLNQGNCRNCNTGIQEAIIVAESADSIEELFFFLMSKPIHLRIAVYKDTEFFKKII